MNSAHYTATPLTWVDRLSERPASWKPALFVLVVGVAINYALVFGLHWDHVYWGLHRPVGQCVATILVNSLIAASAWLLFGPMRSPAASPAVWFVIGPIVIIACLVIGHVVLGGYLLSADEYAYLFEAQTFQQGHLWNSPPPLGQAQTPSYVWIVGTQWVAQYPPGWPGFLALVGAISPSYILAPALLLAATAYGVGELVRKRAEPQDAVLAALFFALSPFALYNGASLLSHTMAACLGVMAMLASREAAARRSVGFALLTGALVGLLVITRSASAVVIAFAVLVDQVTKAGWMRRLIWIGMGGVPFIALLLAYQHAITGNAFMPVYWYEGRKIDHLYFDLPSIKIGIATAFKNFVEITIYTNPAFVLAWLAAIFVLWRGKRLAAADLIYPGGIILFLFYPLYAGQRFGPRYNFDFWPAAVATIGAALPGLSLRARGFCRQALLLATVSGLAVALVIGPLWNMLTVDSFDAFRVIDAAHLDGAVVCLKSPSGRINPLNPYNFPRNGIRSDGKVIRLRCEATTLDAIHRSYPGRKVWAYVRQPNASNGHLEPM